MRPLIAPDRQSRRLPDQVIVNDRPKRSWASAVALIVVLMALAAAVLLLVRAGTDGIGAGPIVTSVLENGGN